MKYRTIILSFLLCLLVLCSCSQEFSSRGQVHVILVALDYANSGIGDLGGTTEDALEMGQCLSGIYASRGIGCTLHYMIQEGADLPASSPSYPTASNILAVLDSIETTERDMIVFYFSGHGDIENEAFSIPEPSMITAKPSSDGPELTLLPFRVLAEALEKKKGTKVALIDCCYAGNLKEDRPTYARSFTQALEDMFSGRTSDEVAIICSCADDELSVTVGKYFSGHMERHGLFTSSMLEALGWKHSDSVYTPVSFCGKVRSAYGYLDEVPQSLTVRELYSRVEEYIGGNQPVSGPQNPCANDTAYDYLIIPEVL